MSVPCQDPPYWSLHPFPLSCEPWLLTACSCTLLLERIALQPWGLPNQGGCTLPPPSHPYPRRPVANHCVIMGTERLASFPGRETAPWCQPGSRAPCGIRWRITFSRTHVFASPFPYPVVSLIPFQVSSEITHSKSTGTRNLL